MTLSAEVRIVDDKRLWDRKELALLLGKWESGQDDYLPNTENLDYVKIENFIKEQILRNIHDFADKVRPNRNSDFDVKCHSCGWIDAMHRMDDKIDEELKLINQEAER